MLCSAAWFPGLVAGIGAFSVASRHFAECVKNVAKNFNALAAGAKWKWKMEWKDDK